MSRQTASLIIFCAFMFLAIAAALINNAAWWSAHLVHP